MAVLTSAIDYDNAVTLTLDTTGATLVVFVESAHGGPTLGAAGGLHDNKSNTLTDLTEHGSFISEGPRHSIRISFVANGAVGTGHAFTRPSGAANGSIGLCAFAGTIASPFDTQSAANSFNAGTPLLRTDPNGSVTPATADSLIVAAWAIDDTNSVATPKFLVDSGFTIAQFIDVAPGSNHGLVIAYKIVSGTAPVSPTLTRTADQQQTGDQGVIAVFKASSSGGFTPVQRRTSTPLGTRVGSRQAD